MKINVKDEFPFPADVVFRTFRDRMDEYVEYTPNITDIQIKEREEVDEKTVRMRCDWGGMGQIPKIVRSILKPEMLRWEDWQTWDAEEMTNSWVIKPFYFREFVNCEGVWKFVQKGEEATEVVCRGVFEVKIEKFPPFPDRLVKRASPAIEKFIGGYLKPNMMSTFRAIKKFIREDMKKQ